MTYESVYSIGEIKSGYNKYENQISDFVEKSKFLYENLERQNTTPDYFIDNIKIEAPSFISFESSDKRPYKNPLFKFMIFVDSDQFELESEVNKIGPIFNENQLKYLPNIICFLDKGVFVYSKMENNSATAMELFPEFRNINDACKWTFREFGIEDFIAGSNLAWLIFSVVTHLNMCHLLKPNMIEYLQNMFKGGKTSFIDIQKTSRPATPEEIEQILKRSL